MRLRHMIAVCLLFGALSSSCAPATPPESGLPSVEAIVAAARRSAAVGDRTVFVKFRASWCEWCARLDAALHSFELAQLIEDHYVVVDVTVQESEDRLALETPGGQRFMDAMGGAAAGLPFYAFLDAAGEKIADSNVLNGNNIGYPVTAEEIRAFGDLMAQTAPKMTAEDQDRVVDYLKTHAP